MSPSTKPPPLLDVVAVASDPLPELVESSVLPEAALSLPLLEVAPVASEALVVLDELDDSPSPPSGVLDPQARSSTELVATMTTELSLFMARR
jgi:hypothetical protein